MAIQKVLVVGMGLMGHGIAQISAAAGLETYVYDISEEAMKTGMGKITKRIESKVSKGKLSEEERDAILARVKPVDKNNLKGLDVDLAIEAVIEDIEVKKKVFAELDALLPEKTILGSNTSALPCGPSGWLCPLTGRRPT